MDVDQNANGVFSEADVIFNSNLSWNSYPGALRNASRGGTLYDFHRVALHEFGHVLGLLDEYGVGRGTGLGQWCAMSTGSHGGRAGGIDVGAPARSVEETARDLLRQQLDEERDAWAVNGLEAIHPADAGGGLRVFHQLFGHIEQGP